MEGLVMLGMGMQAVGAYDEGRQAQQAGRIESQQYAGLASQTRQVTDYKSRLIREAGNQHLADIEAETARAELALSGSPLSLLVDEARKVELETRMNEWEGDVEAQRLQYAGDIARWQGNQARRAGNLKTVTSILSGLSRLYQAKQQE